MESTAVRYIVVELQIDGRFLRYFLSSRATYCSGISQHELLLRTEFLEWIGLVSVSAFKT